jgi:hypothetical protein
MIQIKPYFPARTFYSFSLGILGMVGACHMSAPESTEPGSTHHVSSQLISEEPHGSPPVLADTLDEIGSTQGGLGVPNDSITDVLLEPSIDVDGLEWPEDVSPDADILELCSRLSVEEVSTDYALPGPSGPEPDSLRSYEDKKNETKNKKISEFCRRWFQNTGIVRCQSSKDCRTGEMCSKLGTHCTSGYCKRCTDFDRVPDLLHGNPRNPFTRGGIHKVRTCNDDGNVKCSTSFHQPCAGNHNHLVVEVADCKAAEITPSCYDDAIECKGGAPALEASCGTLSPTASWVDDCGSSGPETDGIWAGHTRLR